MDPFHRPMVKAVVGVLEVETDFSALIMEQLDHLEDNAGITHGNLPDRGSTSQALLPTIPPVNQLSNLLKQLLVP